MLSDFNDVGLSSKMIRANTGDNCFEMSSKSSQSNEISVSHNANSTKNVDISWHLISNDEVLEKLGTSMNGLPAVECRKRIHQYGLNKFTEKNSRSLWRNLLCHLVESFNILIWVASILCFVRYGMTNAADKQILALGLINILGIVISAVFQTNSDRKFEKMKETFKSFIPLRTTVIRDGLQIQVETEHLVPGDICVVKGGDSVPADVRILSSNGLMVDNSSLTGEGVPIKLGVDPHSDSIMEAKNIARKGCIFTCGTGYVVVFSTGDKTFLGSVAQLLYSEYRSSDDFISVEINRLSKIMTGIVIVVEATFFLISIYNGYTFQEALIFGIGIIMANVPLGLQTQAEIVLSFGLKKILKYGVLVKKTALIKDLRNLNVLCCEKTALTTNKLSVSHIVYDGKIYNTPITPNFPDDEFELFDKRNPHFIDLMKIGTLCSNATYQEELSDGVPDMSGNASENALIRFLHPLRSVDEHRNACPRVFWKYMNKCSYSINVQEDRNKNNLILLVKGAPEAILNMCANYYSEEKIKPKDKKAYDELNNIVVKLTERGERIFAFAQKELDEKFTKNSDFDSEPMNFILNDLTFVGLVSMIDPPKANVKNAIQKFQKAGIKVIMITGDHPVTASSIGKSIGLITESNQDGLKGDMPSEESKVVKICSGHEFEECSSKDRRKMLSYEQIIFGRVTPNQKHEIIQELRNMGNFVAMIGRSFSDKPAMKAADIGISMANGSDAANDAAELIVLNSEIDPIVGAVFESRIIFENLKKSFSYVLTSNVPQMIAFILFLLLRIPLGIEALVIILIDIGTDFFPAVSFAFENAEELAINIQSKSKENQNLISFKSVAFIYGTIGLVEALGAFLTWVLVLNDYGFTLANLMGVGLDFRENWDNLANKNYFYNLCHENEYYMRHEFANGKNCEQEFLDWSSNVLSIAQGAFLITVVWCQIGNIFCKKTKIESIFNLKRLLSNKAVFYSIIIEFILLISVIYITGLNKAFLLSNVPAKWFFFGIWIMILIVFLEEAMKFLCRLNFIGRFAHWASF